MALDLCSHNQGLDLVMGLREDTVPGQGLGGVVGSHCAAHQNKPRALKTDPHHSSQPDAHERPRGPHLACRAAPRQGMQRVLEDGIVVEDKGGLHWRLHLSRARATITGACTRGTWQTGWASVCRCHEPRAGTGLPRFSTPCICGKCPSAGRGVDTHLKKTEQARALKASAPAAWDQTSLLMGEWQPLRRGKIPPHA